MADDEVAATAGSAGDQALVGGLTRLVKRLVTLVEDPGQGPSLSETLGEHLGLPASSVPVVTESVSELRVVDVDLALSDLASRDPDARAVGIAGDARHHVTFADLIRVGGSNSGIRIGPPDYASRATGPGEDDHRDVMSDGIRLFRYRGTPVAVRQQDSAPQFGRQEAAVSLLTADRAVGQAMLTEMRQRMDELSVLRGQVVTFAFDPYGQRNAGITFLDRPRLDRSDVVLPDGLLDRVSRHVLGIAAHREALRRHGQHLKRGVLLFGPPGTGKTHTMRYLISASPGMTAILLSGGSLRFVQAATKVARAHEPALVVLEDVDLIAEDRSFGPNGPKPLLFEVLDALDGLDGDADVTFLLTTNRVADLERALSQRPGRIDLAAEIPLPDEAARLALLRLYAGGLFSEAALAEAAARSGGSTASLAKELVRRAVLAAAEAGVAPDDSHLAQALDGLLSDSEELTRSLLGAPAPDRRMAAPGFGPHS